MSAPMDDIRPEDILVTVMHPWSDLTVTLAQWIERGPASRALVRAIHPRIKATGQPLPDEVISVEYQNTPGSRALIRRGLLPNPWPNKAGPYPPAEEYEEASTS
jgi:hypothetical protein